MAEQPPRRKRQRGHEDGNESDSAFNNNSFTENKIRRQLGRISNSMRPSSRDDIMYSAQMLLDAITEPEMSEIFVHLVLDILLEHPLKVMEIAALVRVMHEQNSKIMSLVLNRSIALISQSLGQSLWRQAKLLLRMLCCLQDCLLDTGVFQVLEDLFSKAIELQTQSSHDLVGLELVHIILMNIPFAVKNSSDTSLAQRSAQALLEKTDIIASTPHASESYLSAWISADTSPSVKSSSTISLVQRQLVSEAAQGWKLAFIPKAWVPLEGFAAAPDKVSKLELPRVSIPLDSTAKYSATQPEMFFSFFQCQETASVPSTDDLASCLIRDFINDIIEIFECNRFIAARNILDFYRFFVPDYFVAETRRMDSVLKEHDHPLWRPEDMVVDAILACILRLPDARQKAVYYHSVMIEVCKIAPRTIAPSLGRVIRFFYRNIEHLDIELVHRFTEWFSHHLSNFGFTWKWVEWIDDLSESATNARKSFIIGAIDREVRLSFSARIRGTLPQPYLSLLSSSDEEEAAPSSKFHKPGNCFQEQAQRITALLGARAETKEFKQILADMSNATRHASDKEYEASTDVFVTCLNLVGSKSLSHLDVQIHRYQDQLSDLAQVSQVSRLQTIQSTLDFWSKRPRVAMYSIEKLVKLAIISAEDLVQWLFSEFDQAEQRLADPLNFEMILQCIRWSNGDILKSILSHLHHLLSSNHQAQRIEKSADALDFWIKKWLKAIERHFEMRKTNTD